MQINNKKHLIYCQHCRIRDSISIDLTNNTYLPTYLRYAIENMSLILWPGNDMTDTRSLRHQDKAPRSISRQAQKTLKTQGLHLPPPFPFLLTSLSYTLRDEASIRVGRSAKSIFRIILPC